MMLVALGSPITTQACSVTSLRTYTYARPTIHVDLADANAKAQAFPFDPKPDWERFYASGEDILAYIKQTVRKWNLDRDLQLNTKVIGAHWQQDAGEWRVEVEHQGQRRVEYCDVLISAQGVLVYA